MNYLTLKSRVIVLILLILLLFSLHLFLSRNLEFLDFRENFIFYNLLFAIIMGLVLRERKFTTPVHSLANCLVILLGLIIFKDKINFLFYKFHLWFFSILVIISIIAIFTYAEERQRGFFSETIYRLSIFFGKATVSFSIVFIFAMFSFYINNPKQFVLISCFWGLMIFLFSTNILINVQNYFLEKDVFSKNEIGKIIEETAPGLVTFICNKGIDAKRGNYCFIIKEGVLIYKIFKKLTINNEIHCKAALVERLDMSQVNLDDKLRENKLYLIGVNERLKLFIRNQSIIEAFKNYIGLICENTDINAIRFQNKKGTDLFRFISS